MGWPGIPKSAAGDAGDDASSSHAAQPRLTSKNWARSKRVLGDCIAIVDGLLLIVTSILAKWLYIGAVLEQQQQVEPYAYVGIFAALVTIPVMASRGLYSEEQIIRLRGQVRRIGLGLMFTAFVLLSIAYLFKVSTDFSRGWFITWFALAGFSLLAWHVFVALGLKHLAHKGLFTRHVAVYGSGELAERIIENCSGPDGDVRIVGIFDDPARGQVSKVVTAGGLSDLISRAQSEYFDEILIALPFSEAARISMVLNQLTILPANIRLCPDFMTFQLRPKGLLDYNGATVLEVERKPLDEWAPFLKGLEDRLLSTLGLLVASPLMLLIALAIKIDSRGPVFFQQRRHGFNHEVITVWKFRTMSVLEDGAKVPQAQRNDARITRVGRFLRRTSLDELPQLFNVLKGEMSIVGPRPHALAHNEYYSAKLQLYAQRHKMRPGITGWAQVRGFRGETDTPEKMIQRVQCDLEYIENWSLWFDLKIILMTPFCGLIHKNAY